jgi:predicted enzyme related to lactoylglutathione lyase
MSERESYQPGVPCWVDNLVDDVDAALRFYGGLLGWEFDGPGPGGYYVARVRERDVAGVGQAPAGVEAGWNTYVSVASVEEAARGAARVILEPLDVLPAGRVAVLADPSGARIGLWEPAERQGAQRVNEAGAWAMSVLHTPSPSDFYARAFGWQSEEFAPGMSLFRLPGYVGGEPGQPVPRDVVMAEDDGPAHWSVGFWVSDADELAARAPERGGSVVAAPVDGAGMRHAVLSDPAGATFQVTTAPAPH